MTITERLIQAGFRDEADVAKVAGVTPSCFRAWASRGRVSDRAQLWLTREAHKRGFDLPESIFDIAPNSERTSGEAA